MSINTKKVMKNAWRITRVRGKAALRIRVPGGHIETRFFSLIDEIASDTGTALPISPRGRASSCRE